MVNGEHIAQYEILNRVGSGGMGDVYRARDIRLERDVALKFLSPGLSADPMAKERLLREARAASMLDHPNVCTVFEVGESEEGALFIAMGYCPGQTLEERLRLVPISPDEAVEIARQVASGLAAAHEHGIVHRDIKPGNIIVSHDNRLKIVDFGIAQFSETRLTREGATVGTADYMAPEQIRGQPVDTRADVWAFGVLLYQVLTRRLPFPADYEQAAMYRILHDEPEPLNVDLPPEFSRLADIVEACLQKDPELRPSMQSIADRLRADTPGAVTRKGSLSLRQSQFGARKYFAAAVGVAVLALVVVGVLMVTASSSVPSEKYIAVLPLAVAGESDDDLVLADGLTITLTNTLAQLAAFTDEQYWVVPHSEVRGRAVGSPSVALGAFGATLALEGTLVRQAAGLRLNLSIIDTRTLRRLGAVDLLVANADLGRIHDEAVVRLSEMIHVHLGAGSREALRAGGTVDPDAFDLYLRARSHLERYEIKQNVELAVSLLEQAVAIDPRFGLGYGALGEANWRLFEATKDELYVPIALRHLERALAVDQRLPAAHITMARVYAGTDRIYEALIAIDRIIEQEPSNAEAFITLGKIQNQGGRTAEAEAAFRRAVELRPAHWSGYNELGVFYYRRGRYDEAGQAWRQVVLLTPDNPRGYSNLGALYFQLQRFELASEYFERSINLHPTYGALANLATLYFEQLGDMEKAAETYRRALEIENTDYRIWYYLALATQRLGREEEQRAALIEGIRLAERRLQVNPGELRAMSELAAMYAARGDQTRAAELLAELDSRPVDDIELLSVVAGVHEQLGNREAALSWLCRSLAGGYPPAQIERAPGLAALRADPRFTEMSNCEAQPQ